MADDKISNDIQEALERQVADMRTELKRLSRSLSQRSENWRASAEDAVDDASGHVRNAARAMREHGHAVADTVRENPGTAGALFGTAGVLGVLIGMAIGCALSNNRR